MRFILRFLFLSILISLSLGFYFKNFLNNDPYGEKIIGGTVFFTVIVFLPLFLYYRWKGKNLKDYTLTRENYDRIKSVKKKKKVK